MNYLDAEEHFQLRAFTDGYFLLTVNEKVKKTCMRNNISMYNPLPHPTVEQRAWTKLNSLSLIIR